MVEAWSTVWGRVELSKYNRNRIVVIFRGDATHSNIFPLFTSRQKTYDANNFTINLSQPAVRGSTASQNAALVESEGLSIRFGPATVLFSVKGYYNH